MYTSNNLSHQEVVNTQKQTRFQESEQSADDKNARNINLNLSLLDWQRNQGYLLYFEQKIGLVGAQPMTNAVPEYMWAEWELLQNIFKSFETLYNDLGILIEDEKSPKALKITTNQLLSSHQYQVSNQIIQEIVYESLERFYQSGKFDQDI
jgi:hypothetical protein